MKINFITPRTLRLALLIFAAHTVLFLVQIPQVYLHNVQNPQAAGVWVSIARLAWGVYLWGLITPLILWLGYRLPISRGHLWRNLIFHLLFSVASGVIQHFGYNLGLLGLGLASAESFRASLFSYTVLFNFISSSMVRYAAVIGIQHAYLYSREARERAFRLQQAELQALKVQLRPHFFFNTLNAISALIYRSPKEADRMITQLGDLFRFALREDKTQEIPLAEELDFLKGFLRIHQTLMGSRLQVGWKIEPETLRALVPNLLLQPLVENSIQHGLAPLEQGGLIEVCAARRNGRLVLQVRDSGLGLAERGVPNNGGVGLANTRARLKNLYGAGHRFEIDALPGGGTVVNIEVPFREQAAGRS
ncbi:MAG TPA: histidine kinase [Pyrinomonadaceae bacterium]|nr:histidine kinase [Pyrinomonadaceae bacterium]